MKFKHKKLPKMPKRTAGTDVHVRYQQRLNEVINYNKEQDRLKKQHEDAVNKTRKLYDDAKLGKTGRK
jgi:hypothetical protein